MALRQPGNLREGDRAAGVRKLARSESYQLSGRNSRHDMDMGDSGNGAHLIDPLELPNDDESNNLVKAILQALALRYADDLKRLNLEIDQKSLTRPD